ncbi:MAG: hypothetical protein JNK27_12440 [Chitinophagaceae bacterium]|nr:hypothetical protein [Chitinophagaceae bacterium]
MGFLTSFVGVFANSTETAHNTQQRPFNDSGRPTRAKRPFNDSGRPTRAKNMDIQGQTYYDFERNSVVMPIFNNNRKYVAHELKHGFQFLSGDIALTQFGMMLGNFMDEDAAYDAQDIYTGVNQRGERTYQPGLRLGNDNVASMGWNKYESDPTTIDRIKSFMGNVTKLAFHANNKTYIIEKD